MNERWKCMRCSEPASIRIFSGIGCGGFPGCAQHAELVTTIALETLDSDNLADGYRVVAYEVRKSGYGYLELGRILWKAQRKPKIKPQHP